MKKFFLLISAALLMLSCAKSGDSAGSDSPKRIVSSTPVQTELVGFTLGAKTNVLSADNAFEKHTGCKARTSSERIPGGRALTLAPRGQQFAFGGAEWTYARLLLTSADSIAGVEFVLEAEEAKAAEAQYNGLLKSLKAKYGKANKGRCPEDVAGEYCFWTDDQTTVLLLRESSLNADGTARGACRLRYSCIRLADGMTTTPADL